MFYEIELLRQIDAGLVGLDFTFDNTQRVTTNKSQVEVICEHLFPDLGYKDALKRITFKPKHPYFIETETAVANESWSSDLSEFKRIVGELLARLRSKPFAKSEEDMRSIINAGDEDNHVEFKSSLRWDVGQDKLNTDLEFVVQKAIAAFGNGEGGNLLIGVDDAGNVLGLDRDYRTLKNGLGARDEFELHLRNILNTGLGVVFVSQKINISFLSFEEREVCWIRVMNSDEPLFLEKKNRLGEKREIFYFRSGNQSKDIEKMSEFYNVARTRFP